MDSKEVTYNGEAQTVKTYDYKEAVEALKPFPLHLFRLELRCK